VPNKFTRELKEALLQAAEDVGEVREQDILDADGKPTGRTRLVPTGKDGLIGYLRWAAVHRSNAFIAQLGRILPLQVNAKTQTKVAVKYETVEEVRAGMLERGFSPKMIEAMEAAMQPKFITQRRPTDQVQ
jgi:hypothetical protein